MALMSVTPNLCWDEKEQRSIRSPDIMQGVNIRGSQVKGVWGLSYCLQLFFKSEIISNKKFKKKETKADEEIAW